MFDFNNSSLAPHFYFHNLNSMDLNDFYMFVSNQKNKVIIVQHINNSRYTAYLTIPFILANPCQY